MSKVDALLWLHINESSNADSNFRPCTDLQHKPIFNSLNVTQVILCSKLYPNRCFHLFCPISFAFLTLSILSVLMHLLSLYQSCTNFMTLLNPRNCSTQHQPEEKTDKLSISKALCGWAGTWISIKQAIYINRCTRDLQHNSASSLIGQVLHYDVCCLCHTGRIHSLLMETTKQVVPWAANNGY